MLYEEFYVKSLNKRFLGLRYSNTDVICNGVYLFAYDLPYSIDYRNPKFASGSFIHTIFDVDDTEVSGMLAWGHSIHHCLVGEENSNKYCGQAIKSGNLLQICYLLQRRLMGYDDKPEDGIDIASYYKLRRTFDPCYNQTLLSVVNELPDLSDKINSCKSFSERESELKRVYEYLLSKIGVKVMIAKDKFYIKRDTCSCVLDLYGFNDVHMNNRVIPVFRKVQNELLFSEIIIPELQDVCNELVLRGNQLNSIKLVLKQMLKEKYGIVDIDYSMLFERIGLGVGVRKKDCLRRIKRDTCSCVLELYEVDGDHENNRMIPVFRNTQNELLLSEIIISELQDICNELVLRGNQLNSIKLVLKQILKEKYGIVDIDYSMLFERIGLGVGVRKKDCLRRIKKKKI